MAEGHAASVGCFQHVRTQVYLMGFIFFGIPGAFNSIIGLPIDLPDNTLSLGFGLLYFVFSAGSLVAPALCNKYGPRTMMCLGGIVYVLFSLSLMLGGPLKLVPAPLVTFFAALVGVGAAVLWAGNGQMLLSYPTDYLTASYISTFWVIFNLGAVIGGLQAFLTNINSSSSEESKGASAATFLVYIVMGGVGTAMVFLLQPLESVIREDGTRCQAPRPSSAGQEIRGMFKMMCFGPVLALLPLFLYSNWFYSYQLGIFSKGVFKPAAAGLANALYWGAQMIGAKNLGCLLDAKSLSVGRRAYASVLGSAVLIGVSWLWGGLATVSYGLADDDAKTYEYNDAGAIQAFALMFVWGYCDALVQTWCYWVMKQLFTSSEDFARIAGIFKFAQSFGSAASFLIDYAHPTVMVQLWINIVLFVLSLPGAFYLCWHVSKVQANGPVNNVQKMLD